jgi:hypothetical protein
MQQEVGRTLRLVRESIPQASASLDATVLANYHEYLAEQTAPSGSLSLRKRIAPIALTWSGAVAAAVVLAIVLTFVGRRNAHTTVLPRAMESATVPQSPNPGTTTAAVSEKIKQRTPNKFARQIGRKRAAVSVVDAGSLLPAGFRSLMYCDQLSCAEAMEIIRVQLPTSIPGLTPASTATNDIVFADVLVGSDGIARGIRVVE